MPVKSSEQTQPPVVLTRVRKTFGEQVVLNGIDLEVSHGETVAILGRSGTGKSVLLKLLIRLLEPDSGTIQVLGEEITHLDGPALVRIRKKIGFLFQQAALYDSLTIEENVAFPLLRHTDLRGADLQKRVTELLAQVGMDRELKKYPSQISGGMQKRVGLARALALDPEIVLFDEPTAGLDPITASEINNLIMKMQKEREVTSLVVTHDMHSAKVIADRLVFIDQGRIVTEGTFVELQHSKNEFVGRFLQEAA
jgi:phospholipid/cholesterol/gamma-HCH transport system ATP-binding protein